MVKRRTSPDSPEKKFTSKDRQNSSLSLARSLALSLLMHIHLCVYMCIHMYPNQRLYVNICRYIYIVVYLQIHMQVGVGADVEQEGLQSSKPARKPQGDGPAVAGRGCAGQGLAPSAFKASGIEYSLV